MARPWSFVRAASWMTVALGVWGCTQHTPEAQDLSLAAREPSRAAYARFQHSPEATPLRGLRDAPHLEVRARRREAGDFMCPFEVVARNFPAVSIDGERVATSAKHIDGNADESEEYMEVQLRSVATDRVTQAFEIYARRDADQKRCGQALSHVRRNVRNANRALGETSWRKLTSLGVGLEPWFDEDAENPASELAAPQRPVEFVYRAGAFVARVPGVEVLQRLERPQWRQLDDEFCDTNPHLSQAWGDRNSGVVLVGYNHSSGACLCDDHEYTSALRLAPAVFDEIARRPGEDTA